MSHPSKTLSAVAVILLVLTMYSCQKEISNTIFGSTPLNNFFQANQSVPQKFTIQNVTGTVIQTSKGTKIHFPQNAFVNDNNTVINGTVNIEVKEILNPMDMILNNMPTMSYGAPLESGGEFYIGATVNNKKVQLAPGKKIQVDLPALSVNMDDMRVFNAKMVPDSSGGILMTWALNTQAGNVVKKDTLNVSTLFCDSINWINCDKFYNVPTITCVVNPGNCPNLENVATFIHLTGRNSVLKVYRSDAQSNFWINTIASPATIVGICINTDGLWASITTAQLENGKSFGMNFVKMTEEQLKDKLKQLK